MIQKNNTVIKAKYPPNTMPVAKISFNFQLSGRGEGLTRSFEIVMIVPRVQYKKLNSGYVKMIKKISAWANISGRA